MRPGTKFAVHHVASPGAWWCVVRKILLGAVILTPIAFLAMSLAMLSGPRPDCDPHAARGKVATLCGFENPVDVENAAGARLLLVSQRRRSRDNSGGSIMALTVSASGPSKPWRIWPTGDLKRDIGVRRGLPLLGDPRCNKAPSFDGFSPQGLAARSDVVQGLVRVAVVSHGEREAVELFDVVGRGRKARMIWRGCVPMPGSLAGNDIALVGAQEFIVASDTVVEPGMRGVYYRVFQRFGSTVGHLARWKRGKGWSTLEGTVGPTINGLMLADGGDTVVYSESTTGEIKRMGWRRNALRTPRDRVHIGGRPDNLSLGADGKALLITHLNSVGTTMCKLGNLPCRSDWSLVEFNPNLTEPRQLLRHNGSAVGEVTSVAQMGGYYFFGAAFDDRIGLWRPAIKTAATSKP